MDKQYLDIIRKVWNHSGVDGNVWVPHIYKIGHKTDQKFREGPPLTARSPEFPELRESVDWYWTPAVSSSDSRKAKKYPGQKAIWVDCDESYDRKLLESLKPSYMWETSPGHMQAIWLLKDVLSRKEFHRDGFIGMLTQAIGADPSGVDIGQLLRVPGTTHHKREPFVGKVVSSNGTVLTRGLLLQRVAKGLGFPPGIASDLGADDPYGDRSKVLWRFSRSAAELGIEQDLAFKLIKATKWNKWADDPEKLKDDIARAYEQQPKKKAERAQDDEQDDNEDDEEAKPWIMSPVESFGPVIRKPMSWILPGIIPEAGCGLLVSAPKVGKTRIAIEIALGLATGKAPLGISKAKQRSVGFLSLEDGEMLFAQRLDGSLNTDHGRHGYHWDGHITPELLWEPGIPMNLLTRFEPIDLSEEADQGHLSEIIFKYALDLVIIDTLSMAIGKADVSNSKDMYSILKSVKRIAQKTGCAIMFIHHTRKRVFEKGESIQEMVLGSTALHAWSDFIMNLVAPAEDNDMLRLGVQTKMGNHQHYINTRLKIVKQPPPDN